MKHLLNNLSSEEKNSILEQHKGGMKVMTERFSRLLNAKSGDVKPLVNEQEEDDMMINKPGSGKNITSSVGVTIKNLTKNTEETIMSKFYDSDDYNRVLGDIEATGVNRDFYDDMFGYYVQTVLSKNDYDNYDNLMVEFIFPFSVENLNVENDSKDLVSKLKLTPMGTNKTKVEIYCKIDDYREMYLDGRTDQASPLPGVDSVKCGYGLRFK